MNSRNTLLQSTKVAAMGLVRRGPREIIWAAPVKMGLGNYLYLWLAADRRHQRGFDSKVRVVPGMRPWLKHFPTIERDLCIDPSMVRFRDLRTIGFFQEFGKDFDAHDLESFIGRHLAPSPLFADTSPVPGMGSGSSDNRLVINVRRGDYYSEAKFRGAYGFDIAAYVRIATEQAQASEPISEIFVVSDGPDWCQLKLGWLSDYAPTTFVPPTTDGVSHLVTLATSRRLVLANSTFSYWSAHISNFLHTDNFASIYAPWFHARTFAGGRAFQLDPRWTIIETIPGGWDV